MRQLSTLAASLLLLFALTSSAQPAPSTAVGSNPRADTIATRDQKQELKALNDQLTEAYRNQDNRATYTALDDLGKFREGQKKWIDAMIFYQRAKSAAVLLNDTRSAAIQEQNAARMKEELGNMYSGKQGAGKNMGGAPRQIANPYHLDITDMSKAYTNATKIDSAVLAALKDIKIPGTIASQIQQSLPQSAAHPVTNKTAGDLAEKGDYKEAFKYQLRYTAYRDSMNRIESARRLAAVKLAFDLKKKQSEIGLLKKNERLSSQKSEQQTVMLFGSLGGLLLVGALSLRLYRNNSEKQRANEQLLRQQQDLKDTQAQLIQSEKMASLGELTAGIAHEIQNPLNFVNNFSELSSELVEELKEGIDKKEWAEVAVIATDLKVNLEKINHHGKRADKIVKGMLQHSRASSGQKELTQLNSLAEEYFRLSYHGLRARDKSFNAELVIDLDPDLPAIRLVPQDIGRVLLNLFNNAFQATQEMSVRSGNDYHPQVEILTKKTTAGAEIRIKDNGAGIPKEILDKIFNPFFTTKPTGEGTGLGLSLSYDIITKGHQGKLEVTSKEGEGAEFVMRLPG